MCCDFISCKERKTKDTQKTQRRINAAFCGLCVEHKARLFLAKVRRLKKLLVVIIIPLCVKKPVPEGSGFPTWAFGFAGLAKCSVHMFVFRVDRSNPVFALLFRKYIIRVGYASEHQQDHDSGERYGDVVEAF